MTKVTSDAVTINVNGLDIKTMFEGLRTYFNKTFDCKTIIVKSECKEVLEAFYMGVTAMHEFTKNKVANIILFDCEKKYIFTMPYIDASIIMDKNPDGTISNVGVAGNALAGSQQYCLAIGEIIRQATS